GSTYFAAMTDTDSTAMTNRIIAFLRFNILASKRELGRHSRSCRRQRTKSKRKNRAFRTGRKNGIFVIMVFDQMNEDACYAVGNNSPD
ncbi:hypothetical protein, partial [Thiolapillus sp.]|uniref:hypothetical protein n=1 Tax=Thiolapillus sp. TaxID=2017437 RepID=UPI003AF41626